MAMATMATPEVLRSSHGYVLASSPSLSHTNASPTPPPSCRTNPRQIRPRNAHIASSPLEAPAPLVGTSRFCNWGLQGISLPHSSVPWNPLPARRSSSTFVLQAKKVAEVEVSADTVGGSVGEEVEEEEVEISWVQEKAEDLIVATGQAIDRVPGPRVGESRMPWLVALPLAYLGITFVIAVVKTYRKYTSPKGQRKRQVGKNAFLCEALEEYFPSKRAELDSSKLQKLASKVVAFEWEGSIRRFDFLFALSLAQHVRVSDKVCVRFEEFMATGIVDACILGEYFKEDNDKEELRSLSGARRNSSCNFTMAEVLRKYVRYVLNERPFTPETVADLLHLRKVSGLSEPEVAEVLNDVAKRIVKAKGPVVMNTEGFTEKGIKRKAAVQALFSKLLYLSELEEFVTSDKRSALTIKTTFGVTDDDANLIRIDTLSEQSDVESLERMVGSGESDDEEASSPETESNEKK